MLCLNATLDAFFNKPPVYIDLFFKQVLSFPICIDKVNIKGS